MTDEAEDPAKHGDSGRLTGWRPFAHGDTAGGVPRRPEPTAGSTFSSSLRPSESALGATRSDPDATGRLGLDSSPAVDQSDSFSTGPEPATESLFPTTQLAGVVSEARTKLAGLWSERPEVVIGAAFVGGLLLASIVKRLAR